MTLIVSKSPSETTHWSADDYCQIINDPATWTIVLFISIGKKGEEARCWRDRESECVRDRELLKMEVEWVVKTAVGGTDHFGIS